MSYDAWGARRDNITWARLLAPPARAAAGADVRRGFADHEMLDGVALMHMNGRIYDPLLGVFLSADPLIQSPNEPANHSR